MSSTNVSPNSAIGAASRTSPTASSTVMKNRVTSGSVTVTGSPRCDLLGDHGRAANRGCRGRCRSGPSRRASGRRPCACDDHLGQPLGRAEDATGSAALSVEISTNRSAPCSAAACDQVLGAEHVGLHALARDAARAAAGACGRRRGRRPRGRHRANTCSIRVCVPDVGDDDLVAVEQRPAVQLELQRVHVRLVVVEHVQGRRVVAPDLPAQLLADRAAGPVTRTRAPARSWPAPTARGSGARPGRAGR